MTVEYITGTHAMCSWFDGRGHHQKTIAVAALKLSPADSSAR
jgi:hypothetical protein